jgi:hypothetical protein
VGHGNAGGEGWEWQDSAHRSVLLVVAGAGEVIGAYADTQQVPGEGVEVTVWCRRQVLVAASGVDAGDEHREYGGYRAGQERGYGEWDDGGGHLPALFSSSDVALWVTGRSFSWVPEKQVTVTVGRGKGKTNNTVR